MKMPWVKPVKIDEQVAAEAQARKEALEKQERAMRKLVVTAIERAMGFDHKETKQ